MKIEGIVVTDARSLFDHLSTTGSVPKERQTLIDLLVARDLIEEKALLLRWVPTTHQLGDLFTKLVQPSTIMKKLLTTQRYSLVPTVDEETEEDRRKVLRQDQRKRRKERRDVERASI